MPGEIEGGSRRVIGWRAHYDNDLVIDSKHGRLNSLPLSGIQTFVLFQDMMYESWNPETKKFETYRYKYVLRSHDYVWYDAKTKTAGWYEPGAGRMGLYHLDSGKFEELDGRPPVTATVIAGREIDYDSYKNIVNAEMRPEMW